MTQTIVKPVANKTGQLAEKHADILGRMATLYAEIFNHDGYGDFRVEMKILRRGQKEIIIHCGKQYRYVVDCDEALKAEHPLKALLKRDILG